MPPQARLIFVLTASSQPPLSPTPPGEKPLPSPPPAVDVQGDFSLLPGGGLRVGGMSIRVERGTQVERIEGVNGERGLSWMGKLGERNEGLWELWLQGATEADVIAVHRILLFLPPISDPAPAPSPASLPYAADPSYRNSLLLFDETSRSVIGVIPLSGDPPARPAAPGRPSVTHVTGHVHPLEPSPTSHTSAADFAHYIDHAVRNISPAPTPEHLASVKQAKAAERKRMADKEQRSLEELPIPLPFFDEDKLDPVPPLPSTSASESGDYAEAEGDDEEEEDEPRTKSSCDRLKRGMERLDLEMSLAREPTSLPHLVRSSSMEVPDTAISLRPASTWTVSSLATFGTERFVVADEGPAAAGASCRGSFSAVQPMASPLEARGEEDTTPRATQISSAPLLLTPAIPLPPTLATFDPNHTVTNGNAVLLSFLNSPSTLLPSLSATSPSSASNPPRMVATRALSAQEASELTLRDKIRPFELDAASAGEEGKTQGGDDDEATGWWEWLSGYWRPVPFASPSAPQVDAEQLESGGWLDWLFLPSFLNFSSPPTSNNPPSSTSCPSSAARARPRSPRKPGAEATSRVSVYHVDDAGRGRRAFVARG
ncbi:hypothetical protein JCM11641_001932 [Rhodosporidiobolus odoratus]